MTEDEGRAAILRAADSWLHTPYTYAGQMKGIGANCATLMYGIARDAGVLPEDAREPKWYTPQFHVHQREERLIDRVMGYRLTEISEAEAKPGDIVAYLTGQSHGHLGLIVDWPTRIVQTTQSHGCQYAHGLQGALAHCTRRFFSIWPRES